MSGKLQIEGEENAEKVVENLNEFAVIAKSKL